MRKSWLLSVLLGLAVLCTLASGWWVKGHESIAEAAAAGLPREVPAFFRAGGKSLAHYAGDPDRWKNRAAKHLKASVFPDHYIDLENLQGKDLPDDRYQAAELLARLKEKPDRTGMLPYAIMENYDRLSCAFYDHRAEPKNEAIRAKCLVYAGILAHYTGDAVMPLHTTRDYDGKKGPGGKIVQQGIHKKIDAFPEENHFTPEQICKGLKARKIKDVWAHVVATIKESHRHVKKCYDLDAVGAFDKPTDESRAFIMERCRVGAQFTMDLWYTAWLRSARMPKHY
jgi:hypothetical protein